MNWQAANAIARTIPMLYTREEKKRKASELLEIIRKELCDKQKKKQSPH